MYCAKKKICPANHTKLNTSNQDEKLGWEDAEEKQGEDEGGGQLQAKEDAVTGDAGSHSKPPKAAKQQKLQHTRANLFLT